jgi:hypothetical protein
VIASIVWVGAIIIASVSARDFRWIRFGDPGPAMIVAFVGVVLICVLCFGVPWIAGATKKPLGK